MTPSEKLTQIAENVPKVYEAGKKSEYDAFWDSYQQNGNRKHYGVAFGGKGWNEHTLKPKYDIKPTSAYMMFYQLEAGANIDLVKIEEECGITFDFSECTDFQYLAYTSGVLRFGIIDTRAKGAFAQFLGNSSTLHTVKKLILKDDGSQTISNASWFLPNSLVNIEVEGKLGYSVRCVSANMTKASIASLINALYEGSAGQTLTLSKSAVNKTFGGVDDEEWKSLVDTKPNWTISLI
ncbi:MAG: hypothetical protein IJN74_01455 [Clostridia bacterium]|nr:hypothetical protein [Clostridia bacterium]